jgi:hypothetical protein
MSEFIEPTVAVEGEVVTPADVAPPAEIAVPETPAVEPAELPVEPSANGVAHQQRAEAGRKGANRVHQLIRAGRLYEQEHGLKRGRQRLRQLIELGKLYEQEHGLRPAPRKRGARLSRTDRDAVVATLLQCLRRIAKPSFRPELERLAAALHDDAGHAA